MKLRRYLVLALALVLAALAAPALAGAAPANKLAAYTAPNGQWSIRYPADLLHVEQLNEDVTIFISKDRHTFAAIDSYDATSAAHGDVLIRRGQAALRQIYGKSVKNTGALESPGARWEVGFGFSTAKGSEGTALYHQNGRVDADYRVFGFVYGYKSGSEQSMRPILEAIGESLRIRPPTPTRLDYARDALRAYVGALYAGRYADAAKLYGGRYETLIGWNPDVAAGDRVKLLERGCEQNGLQCLRLKRIVGETAISASEFRFTVEFLNGDGTTFGLKPCCGGIAKRAIIQFDFTVEKVGAAYLVQELPVYVA
jgi:hypothetical protein